MKTVSFAVRHIVFVVAIMLFATCDSIEPEAHLLKLDSTAKNVASASDLFTLHFARKIISANEDANVMASPLSLSMALGMTLNGSEATTFDEMRSVLGLNGFSMQEINESYQSIMTQLPSLDSETNLELANAIWYRASFPVKTEFLQTNERYFDAEISGLNFDSPDAPTIINDWVNDATHGRISEMVDNIAPETMLYLMNALYFKGAWTTSFSEDATAPFTFYRFGDSHVSVPGMRKTARLPYIETTSIQAVELPYGSEVFSMIIVLPKTGTPGEILQAFDAASWQTEWSSFEVDSIALVLPKFSFESELPLRNVLVAMGMKKAFLPEADLGGIADVTDLHISDVLQKTFIEVNEEGTEATAVTSIEVGVTSVDPDAPIPMVVNRPFLFLIRERTSGLILFIGQVVDPSSA